MNGLNVLNEGIYLENENVIFTWNKSVEELSALSAPRKIVDTDRVIYKWENKTFLNGLNGDLEIRFWNGEEHKMKDILLCYEGGEALSHFVRIANHLSSHITEPLKKIDEDDYDRSWEWIHKGIKITLGIFEAQEYRCVLKIQK